MATAALERSSWIPEPSEGRDVHRAVAAEGGVPAGVEALDRGTWEAGAIGPSASE